MGLLHIAIFSLYQNFHFLRRHSLTRMFVSLYKNTYSKSITKISLWKCKTICFFFPLVFCLQKCPMIYFWTYAFERNYHLQMNKIERHSLMALRNRIIYLDYSIKSPTLCILMMSSSLTSPAEQNFQLSLLIFLNESRPASQDFTRSTSNTQCFPFTTKFISPINGNSSVNTSRYEYLYS